MQQDHMLRPIGGFGGYIQVHHYFSPCQEKKMLITFSAVCFPHKGQW